VFRTGLNKPRDPALDNTVTLRADVRRRAVAGELDHVDAERLGGHVEGLETKGVPLQNRSNLAALSFSIAESNKGYTRFKYLPKISCSNQPVERSEQKKRSTEYLFIINMKISTKICSLVALPRNGNRRHCP
jgi:hypothetical protein